ncbi:vesicular inhibitory amino acid transporter-like [Aulostomus maculatus]
MLILTQSDELNRNYSEDDSITNKDNASTNSRTRCQTLRKETGVLDNPAVRGRHAPDTSTSVYKETAATITSDGTTTITITTAVQDTSRTCYSKEGRPSAIAAGKRRFYRPARYPGENVQKQKLAEDGQDICTSTEEEQATVDQSDTGLNPTITAWEAGWNVTNAIQGIFVLGLPFALARSGYVGLVLLVLSAWICNHTGRILITCLYEEEESGGSCPGSKVRVRHSYQDIVEACCKGLWISWPGLGGWMVNVAQVIELLMTCTLYLVVSTSILSDSLWGTAVPRSVCSLASLLFLLPCLFLTDLRPVSTLSLLCSFAHVLISLLVILYCLSLASIWSWSCLPLSVDPEDLLVSVGVIIFSYTSQIFLPPIEGSMEDRGQFNTMLRLTHGAACIMKTTFALLAVLTWGAETREVITDNLPSDLRPLVNLFLLAKALLSYPLPFYSAAEILQTCLLPDFPQIHGCRNAFRSALLARGTLLMTSFLLALLMPRFSLLMGLTGSVTGAAMTLILPCLCHLRLQWGFLSPRERLMDAAILSLGVTCSVSGVICSVKRLVGGL